jgi:hypothetical protein
LYAITTCEKIGDRIFQHYVDITLRNEISPTGDAVFYDLFLDVVADEDDDAIAMGLKYSLEKENYEVVHARTKSEALSTSPGILDN